MYLFSTRSKANKWAIMIFYVRWIEMVFETLFLPCVHHEFKCNQRSFGSIWTSVKGIHFKLRRDRIMMFSTLTWHELWLNSGKYISSTLFVIWTFKGFLFNRIMLVSAISVPFVIGRSRRDYSEKSLSRFVWDVHGTTAHWTKFWPTQFRYEQIQKTSPM